MKINEIIRKKREALSLTQKQVADYLGVSTPAVHKWEKGSTYPDKRILRNNLCLPACRILLYKRITLEI